MCASFCISANAKVCLRPPFPVLAYSTETTKKTVAAMYANAAPPITFNTIPVSTLTGVVVLPPSTTHTAAGAKNTNRSAAAQSSMPNTAVRG